MKTGFRIRMLLAFTLTSLFVAIGCDDDEIIDGEKAFTVSGSITDSVSGQPLDSVRISFGDTLMQTLEGLTDSLGQYTYTVPQNGQIIWARKEGYISKGREIVGISSDLTNFDFELRLQ